MQLTVLLGVICYTVTLAGGHDSVSQSTLHTLHAPQVMKERKQHQHQQQQVHSRQRQVEEEEDGEQQENEKQDKYHDQEDHSLWQAPVTAVKSKMKKPAYTLVSCNDQ